MMDPTGSRLPRMMIGFVVRRCAVDLGRPPTAAEFAQWANHRGTNGTDSALFGRPITEAEARVILSHQARLVTAKSAAPDERYEEVDEWELPAMHGSNVITLAEARARLTASCAAAPHRRR